MFSISLTVTRFFFLLLTRTANMNRIFRKFNERRSAFVMCLHQPLLCVTRAASGTCILSQSNHILPLQRKAQRGMESVLGGGLDSICCRFTSNTALMFVLCTDSGNVAISSSVDTHFVLFPSTAAATLLDSLQWSGRLWLKCKLNWFKM